MAPPAARNPSHPPDPDQEASGNFQEKKRGRKKGRKRRGRDFGKGRIIPEKHIPGSL